MFIIPDIHDICDTFDRYYIKTCCPCCRLLPACCLECLLRLVLQACCNQKISCAPLLSAPYLFHPLSTKKAPPKERYLSCNFTDFSRRLFFFQSDHRRLFSLLHTHISLFQDSPLSGSRFLMHMRPIRMTNRHPRSCMIVAMHTGSKDA